MLGERVLCEWGAIKRRCRRHCCGCGRVGVCGYHGRIRWGLRWSLRQRNMIVLRRNSTIDVTITAHNATERDVRRRDGDRAHGLRWM